MAAKIRVLSEDTINKIAAGEVIENTSSVVKELVENSLDAGASAITIEIQSGGRQLIRITDNGCGMSSDDALLCLERHATSKIRDIDDVSVISTMGFRGEAIPSIASISQFMIITATGEEKEGTLVVVEGGKLLKHGKASRDRGTTMEIKSLFYNLPVRKKFQKSPAYDTQEIFKVISQLALANPEVAFHLVSDKSNLLKTRPESLQDRIKSVLGPEFSAAAWPLVCESPPYKLEGIVGAPSEHRANRTGQHLFINKRPVWSPLISSIIKEAYGTLLPAGRFPIFVLNLQMISSLVDVNVHPQKREVRLRGELQLKQVLGNAVAQALQSKTMQAMPKPLGQEVPAMPWRPAPFIVEPVFLQEAAEKDACKLLEPKALLETPVIAKSTFSKKPPIPNSVLQEEPAVYQTAKKVLQTLSGYLLLETEGDQLCLVDQKRAHHRILFERMVVAEQRKPIAQQQLLMPLMIQLTQQEAHAAAFCMEALCKFGVQAELFGKNSVKVDAIPTFIRETQIEEFVREVMQESGHIQEGKEKLAKEKELAYYAAKAAVNKRSRLPLQEAQYLVEELYRCQMPYQCPYGKPTHQFLVSEELAKIFK